MVRQLALTILIAFIATACGTEEESTMNEKTSGGDFDATVYEAERIEKDEFFKSNDNSPIPSEERALFEGLNYFPPRAEYVVTAKLVRTKDPDTVKMPTTQDDLRDGFEYGVFEFKLRGKDVSLPAYRFVGAEHQYLFVPFTDKTTGLESYGTGRYLDIEMQDGDMYTIDFNQAYNPLCAYNDNYSCPLVPKQNALPVAVEAGEQAWH